MGMEGMVKKCCKKNIYIELIDVIKSFINNYFCKSSSTQKNSCAIPPTKYLIDSPSVVTYITL